MASPPVTRQVELPCPSGTISTCAPIVFRYPGSKPPGCVVRSGQLGTLICPPPIRAAPRKGAAFDRSGSTWTRSGSRVPADPLPLTLHLQRSGLAWTWTPALRRSSTVMAMCGRLGRCRPEWTMVIVPSALAARSRRPETNCEDAEESMVTSLPTRQSGGVSAKGRKPSWPRYSILAPSWVRPSNRGLIGRR